MLDYVAENLTGNQGTLFAEALNEGFRPVHPFLQMNYSRSCMDEPLIFDDFKFLSQSPNYKYLHCLTKSVCFQCIAWKQNFPFVDGTE